MTGIGGFYKTASKDILKTTSYPLTALEIWKIMQIKYASKLRALHGKTKFNSVESALYRLATSSSSNVKRYQCQGKTKEGMKYNYKYYYGNCENLIPLTKPKLKPDYCLNSSRIHNKLQHLAVLTLLDMSKKNQI